MLNPDPYFLNAKIPFGIYKDRLINTSERKAISILDGTPYAEDYPQQPEHWLVANVFHNNEFYIAQIPKGAGCELLFLTEPFGMALAHTMVRFKFNQPILLVAKTPSKEEFERLKPGEILKDPIILKNLMLTVEATSPPGIVEFAAVASFFYTRGLAMRFISLTGRGVKKYLVDGSQVLQYKLNFTPAECSEMFETALLASHKNGMKKMYQTMFANCNWFVFNMLEKSKDYIGNSKNPLKLIIAYLRVLASRIVLFSKIYPPLAKFGLTWRSWRNADEVQQNNLEDEPEFLALAKTHPEYAQIKSVVS